MFSDENTQNTLIHPQLKSYSHRGRNDNGKRHIVGRPKLTVTMCLTLSLFGSTVHPFEAEDGCERSEQLHKLYFSLCYLSNFGEVRVSQISHIPG